MKNRLNGLRAYCVTECYSAQIEAWALIGLRVGFTAWGVAFWPNGWHKEPWWLPHLTLDLWSHTGQCDQRMLFDLHFGGFRVGFRTRGDATPDMATYYDAGWVVRFPHLSGTRRKWAKEKAGL